MFKSVISVIFFGASALVCFADSSLTLSRASYKESGTYDTSSLQAGIKQCDNGEWSSAIENLDKVIENNPKAASAYQYRGIAYFSTGNFHKAIRDFSQIIRLEPDNDRAYLDRGSAYRELRDFDKAQADLSRSIELNVTNATAYKLLAAVYHAKENFRGEISQWNEALRLDPADTMPLLARGWAFFATGQFEKAIHDYEEAIVKEPTNDGAFNGLAWVLAKCPKKNLRDGKAAVDYATTACDLTQWSRAEWIDTLAAAYAATGDYLNAAKFETQAIDANKDGEPRRAAMERRLAEYKKQPGAR